jgi:hypothetical protein
MRYLALALFAEGPTDHEFLPRVIFRLTTEISAQISDQPVEVAEQFVRPAVLLRHPGAPSRAERVVALFGDALGPVDLLFIHADGQRDSDSAYEERIRPCCDLLHAEFPGTIFECVGIVPVRETEAWAIADVGAVTRALGTTKSAVELGLPNSARSAENEVDPKAVLRHAQDIAMGRRRRVRARTGSIHAVLGETVGLAALREMRAFQTFESSLRAALQRMWQAA